MNSNADSPGTPVHVPPQVLGHYVIEGELGRGGMGVVYLARDRKLDRQVAIKTLPAEVARDPEQLGRFEREAKLLASLNHPNIATIHGLEEAGDATRYLILERVEGETLADRLARGRLPVDETVRICDQVVDAVEAAHERGVIHRDLKPGNVMITPGGRVKVLDFGLAKRTGLDAHAASDESTSEAGVMEGTPGYMSPEQVMSLPHDARADVFSFGCVLFECLAGSRAFDGESLPVLWAQVLNGEPDWNKLPSEAPTGFRHLIERCLEKDPDRRLASMHDVRRGLRALMADHAAGTTTKMASLAGTLHNLPREVASFVGRERELEECGRLLSQTRILTLTGAGGSGKTRLALKLVAGLIEQHAGGVWFVDFGPLSDQALVNQAVAQALGVREDSGRTLERGLIERLSGPPVLLVLDNCEHVLETCDPLVDTLLQGCENLKVVATSREALGLSGEQVYSVPTLPVPAAGKRLGLDELAVFASVRLFVERAIQVQPAFVLDAKNAESVAEICRRLDGIPFAIELAAARAKVLAVDQIRAKLDDLFRLLTGGSKAALPRQQTLRATIQWSYDHLHPEEQQLMRGLAVFAGGWTLESATAVCGISDDEFEVLDLLTRLIDKSLVVVEHARGGESRYRFLETVRQYALERLLEAGESEAARDRHIAFFCALAEQAEPQLRGQNQAEWIRRLNAEHENLLTALAWREPPAGKPELALRLGGAIFRFWLIGGHFGVGRRLLGELLQHAASGQPEARTKVLYGSSLLAFAQGDYQAAKIGVTDCLSFYREAGDNERVAACLGMLGNVASAQGDFPQARERFEEALSASRDRQDQRGVATHLNNLGVMSLRQRDLDGARILFDEAVGVLRGLGDKNGLSMALSNLANILVRLGDVSASRRHLVENVRLVQELGGSKRPLMDALDVSTHLATATQQAATAATLLGALEALRETLGMQRGPAESKENEEIRLRIRGQIDERDFNAAWETGHAKNAEEASAFALAWLEETSAGVTPTP